MFTGRGGEVHKLVKTENNVYSIVTDYPIRTIGEPIGEPDEIIALDFSGGPIIIVGELLEFGVQIDAIKHINEIGIFVMLKEI